MSAQTVREPDIVVGTVTWPWDSQLRKNGSISGGGKRLSPFQSVQNSSGAYVASCSAGNRGSVFEDRVAGV